MTEKNNQINAIQQELINTVIPGGMMGGYNEEGFPFYYINDKMLEYLQYPDKETFIQDVDGLIINCIHPDDRETVDLECSKQLEVTGGYEVDYRMRRRDGQYIWVHDVGKLIEADDGREAIISLCCDITKEREQNVLFSNLINSINGSMGMYTVGPGYTLTPIFISEGMGSMIGLSKEEYMEICADDAINCIFADDREKIRQAIAESIRSKKATSTTFRSRTKDGGYIWLNGAYTQSGESDGLPLLKVVFTPVSTQFEQQQNIIQNMPGGICLYRWDGQTIYPVIINKRYSELHGGDASANINGLNFEFIHFDDLDGYKDFIQQGIDHPGQENSFHYRLWNVKKKRYIWIAVNMTNIAQNDGTQLIYASYSDIDEIKNVEIKLRHNEDVLKARIQMEQKRLAGGNKGRLVAYVVSNISKDRVVEHKTFMNESPVATTDDTMLEGALKYGRFIIDQEKREEFIAVHNPKNLMKAYTNGQDRIQLEYRRQKPGGMIIWENNILNLLREPQSGEIYLYEYCYDINKEKLMEEIMLAAINYDYERVSSINLAQSRISWLHPTDDTLDYILETAEYFQLCQHYAHTKVHEDDREFFLENVSVENLSKQLKNGEVYEFTHREYKDNGEVGIKLNRHVYYDADNQLCLMTRSDITSSVKAEEEKQNQLRIALAKEKKALQIKTDFLSRMSHELRTPLNAIAGYAELLRQNCIDDHSDSHQDLDHIASINKSTKYLLTLISDILDTQKMEEQKIELVKTKVNADEYMANIVDMITPEAKKKNIDFTYTRLTEFSTYYVIDAVRLDQVLLNLLHNAVKFTPEGGKVQMTAGAIKQEGKQTTLQFTVSDTGIGMSADFVAEELYKPFTQEHHDLTSPYEGTGLGLTICKELVQLMEGTITCTSKPGEGTRFTATIVAEAATAKRTKRHRHKSSATHFDLHGVRILICEDNVMNQDMTKRLLERMNCRVDVADNGKIGVDQFVASPENYYDFVLMDLRMPEMDGYEATINIRALNRADAKQVPILALSANTFEDDVRKCIDVGMNEHLAKPISAPLLYAKIKDYCHLSDSAG